MEGVCISFRKYHLLCIYTPEMVKALSRWERYAPLLPNQKD